MSSEPRDSQAWWRVLLADTRQGAVGAATGVAFTAAGAGILAVYDVSVPAWLVVLALVAAALALVAVTRGRQGRHLEADRAHERAAAGLRGELLVAREQVRELDTKVADLERELRTGGAGERLPAGPAASWVRQARALLPDPAYEEKKITYAERDQVVGLADEIARGTNSSAASTVCNAWRAMPAHQFTRAALASAARQLGGIALSAPKADQDEDAARQAA